MIVVGVTPSVYVKVNGAVPVNVKTTSGNGSPVHTGPPPLMVAVGSGLTIIEIGVPTLTQPVVVFLTVRVAEYVLAVAVIGIDIAIGLGVRNALDISTKPAASAAGSKSMLYWDGVPVTPE